MLAVLTFVPQVLENNHFAGFSYASSTLERIKIMESLRIIRTFSAPSYAEVLQREVEAKKALALRCQAAIQALNEKLLEKKLRECGESAGKTYFGMFRVRQSCERLKK
jgi:hypothetical protein